MHVLDVQGLSIGFPRPAGATRTVVQDVSFAMQAGSVFALVGESGSGKSMIARAIVGLLPGGGQIGAGSIRLQDTNLVGLSAARLRKVRGRQIGMIFQEPMVSLNPTLRIGRQLAEAAEQHTSMSYAEIEERAVDLLDRVRVSDPRAALRRFPHEFSGGMCQRVMIASALMLKPKLVIADEPTTALDRLVQKDVLEILLAVTLQEGAAVLLISHDLGLVAGYADSVAVLKKGCIVEQGPSSQVLARPAHSYTRTLLGSLPASRARGPKAPEPDVVCSIRNLTVEYPVRRDWFWQKRRYKPVLKGINLDIRRGKTLALVGESGSGKSTIGRAILQLVDVRSGSITLDGVSVATGARPGIRAMSPIVQLIFQNPYAALSPRIRVLETVAEPLLRREDLSRARVRERAQQMLSDVGLDESFAARLPRELSGGQRQRVSIARALIVEPKLVIADEPVSALDMSTQARILELLRQLQERHRFACLFISHDLGVVESIADRVAVLLRGEIVETGDVERLFAAPEHPYTRALLEASPELRKIDDDRYELRSRDYSET
jgi:peptide/nickel transport system ATP-binding protein